MVPAVQLGLIAKISVIAMLIATTAAAQTPATPPAQIRPGLLSTSAFAQLPQGKTPATNPVALSRDSRSEEARPSLLTQALTLAPRLARSSALPEPPRRRGLANWQKQVLFWGGIVGGLIVLGALEAHSD